jgi:DNA invertase Pin-like site-specific DNA recombinase
MAAIRAAAYYRMSKDEQEHSIDRQRGQVLPYAARKGYEIIREYKDEGIQGWKDGDKRPDFRRMLEDGRAGHFEVILCDDVDRFGRFDPLKYGAVVVPLREAGVRLETVAQGPIDWDDTLSALNDAIRMAFRKEESNNTSRRILTRFILMAREGIWVNGTPPYGYAKDPQTKKLVPGDPAHVKVVKWLFQTYATKDVSLRWLVEELCQRAVPSPKGKKRWSPQALYKMLSNRNYLGDLHWNETTKGEFQEIIGQSVVKRKIKGERRKPAADWIIVQESHEALVDRETFEMVQAKLAGHKVHTTPWVGGGDWLLSGLMTCGHCGNRMVGTAKWGKRVYLCNGYNKWGKTVCHHNIIHEAPLVAYLVRKLQEDFLNPDNLQKAREEIRRQDEEEHRPDPSQAKSLRAKVSDLERRIGQATERLPVIPSDLLVDYAEMIRRLKDERNRALEDLAATEGRDDYRNAEEQLAEAEAYLWRLREAIQAAEPSEVRAVLREFISRIELFWEHEQRGKFTKGRFMRGLIYIRTDERLVHTCQPYPGGGAGGAATTKVRPSPTAFLAGSAYRAIPVGSGASGTRRTRPT